MQQSSIPTSSSPAPISLGLAITLVLLSSACAPRGPLFEAELAQVYETAKKAEIANTRETLIELRTAISIANDKIKNSQRSEATKKKAYEILNCYEEVGNALSVLQFTQMWAARTGINL